MLLPVHDMIKQCCTWSYLTFIEGVTSIQAIHSGHTSCSDVLCVHGMVDMVMKLLLAVGADCCHDWHAAFTLS